MKKATAKKPIPPRPPQRLCNSWFHWVLGIVSPSKLNFDDSDEAKAYRLELKKYYDNIDLWKIKNRLMKSKEWKRYYHEQRVPTEPDGTGDSIGQSWLEGFLDGLKNGRSGNAES